MQIEDLTPQQIYESLLTLDHKEAVDYALLSGYLKSDSDAKKALHGWLMWIAIHQLGRSRGLQIGLPIGLILELHKASLVSNDLWHLTKVKSCLQFEIHHICLSQKDRGNYDGKRILKQTRDLLVEAFGDEFTTLNVWPRSYIKLGLLSSYATHVPKVAEVQAEASKYPDHV